MLFVSLKNEHLRCLICSEKFATDLESQDDSVCMHLPILSIAKTRCTHYFCWGCICNQQVKQAETARGRCQKWICCPVCQDDAKQAFDCSNPKFHILLVDLISRGRDEHTTRELLDCPERMKQEDDSDVVCGNVQHVPKKERDEDLVSHGKDRTKKNVKNTISTNFNTISFLLFRSIFRNVSFRKNA